LNGSLFLNFCHNHKSKAMKEDCLNCETNVIVEWSINQSLPTLHLMSNINSSNFF